MNTPAHGVFNLLLLDRKAAGKMTLPVVAGALLPDLPMIGFYFYQKAAGASERAIWMEHYHSPGWQAFFDLFNSLPIAGLLLLLAWRLERRGLLFFAASLALHSLTDLPLHTYDGHRHFFPFSDWRFQSPVSYWDPRHFGHLISNLEAIMVGAGCLLYGFRKRTIQHGLVAAALALAYLFYRGFAIVVWG